MTQFEAYLITTRAGRIIFHSFSLWEKRCVYKFCNPEDWPRWQGLGYRVQKILVTELEGNMIPEIAVAANLHPPDKPPLVATGYDDEIERLGEQIAKLTSAQAAELNRYLDERFMKGVGTYGR